MFYQSHSASALNSFIPHSIAPYEFKIYPEQILEIFALNYQHTYSKTS